MRHQPATLLAADVHSGLVLCQFSLPLQAVVAVAVERDLNVPRSRMIVYAWFAVRAIFLSVSGTVVVPQLQFMLLETS